MVWKNSWGDGCWAAEVDMYRSPLFCIEAATDSIGLVRAELLQPRSRPSAQLGDACGASRRFAVVLRRCGKTCETDPLLRRASGARLRTTQRRRPTTRLRR